MPTFRDIARAWYPGQDPNKRQQSVNKFCQDTLGNFYQATREATGSTNGGLANFRSKVLGNEKNFRKFLDIMKEISDKRASNKRSIINKGKTPEAPKNSQTEQTVTEDEIFDGFFGDEDKDTKDTNTKYFVVVMKDKQSGQASFTFVEADDENDAKKTALAKFPNADVITI
jgi:hypothetical protein